MPQGVTRSNRVLKNISKDQDFFHATREICTILSHRQRGCKSEIAKFKKIPGNLLVCVLLCFIDPRVGKIRNEASSCPGIFSRTLRFYYVASSPGSPLPHLLDGHRKLVGCSAVTKKLQTRIPIVKGVIVLRNDTVTKMLLSDAAEVPCAGP